jgi:hypothetical protein
MSSKWDAVCSMQQAGGEEGEEREGAEDEERRWDGSSEQGRSPSLKHPRPPQLQQLAGGPQQPRQQQQQQQPGTLTHSEADALIRCAEWQRRALAAGHENIRLAEELADTGSAKRSCGVRIHCCRSSWRALRPAVGMGP